MSKRILSIDPSGTGTTGVFFKGEDWEQFCSHQGSDWKKHYEFIAGMVKVYHPDILLYEHTNFISLRGKDMTSLLKLLGTMETLTLSCSVASPRIEAVPVNQVKELRNKLLKGTQTIAELEYKKGKGWHHNQKKITVHCLDAYLVYWIWKQKSSLIGKSIANSKNKAKDKPKVIEEELAEDINSLPEDNIIFCPEIPEEEPEEPEFIPECGEFGDDDFPFPDEPEDEEPEDIDEEIEND